MTRWITASSASDSKTPTPRCSIGLRETEETKPAPNLELVRRYVHPRRESKTMIEQLESGPLESLLHIATGSS